jgi:serine/threonine-protein kinase
LIVAATAWWLGAGRWTEMPSVVGLDRVSAERVLAESDLTASYAERSDDSIPEGSVIATDPAPAVQVPRGSGVTLTISTGRPQVPAIAAGTDVAEAQRLISEAGLTPKDSEQGEFSASVTEGTVLRTDPAAGTRLASGSPVALVLSAGPQPPPEEDRYPPGLGRILEDLGLGNDNGGPGNGNGNGRGRGRGGDG